MAQPGSQEWTEGWGVVRIVDEKIKEIEFVAFFDTREDAEAAAVEAGVGVQVCWVSYRDGAGIHLPASAKTRP
jgi:hypothetical protein